MTAPQLCCLTPQAQLFDREAELGRYIPGNDIASVKSATVNGKAIRLRDTLSIVSSLYAHFSTLLAIRWGPIQKLSSF